MEKERTYFKKGQLVHLISRAVDERKVFQERNDCLRFLFQLYAANNGTPKPSIARHNINNFVSELLNGRKTDCHNFITDRHEPFVHIIDFSLVITHYHIYAIVNTENSIAGFMSRLNNGFARYYNLKHNRKGALFGSRYKSILVDNDFQADAVSRYVNTINPLDVYQPGWREEGLNDLDAAIKFLEDYEFSSFPDKVGKRKSSILALPELLSDYSFLQNNTNGAEDYKKYIKEFLKGRTGEFLLQVFE